MDTSEPTLLQKTTAKLQELATERKRSVEEKYDQDDDEEDWSDFGGKSIEEWLELLNDDSFTKMTEDEIEKGATRALKAMLDFLTNHKIVYYDLEIVGCDGCPTNTGKHNGIIRQLELKIGRPVQHAICIFHCNELPLRQLFFYLDGTSTDPSSFSGEIGHQLAIDENLPVVGGYWHFQVDYFPKLDNVSHLIEDGSTVRKVSSRSKTRSKWRAFGELARTSPPWITRI